MDQDTRNKLQRATQQVRRILEEEFAEQLVRGLTEKAKIERFEADGSAPRMKRIQPAPPAR